MSGDIGGIWFNLILSILVEVASAVPHIPESFMFSDRALKEAEYQVKDGTKVCHCSIMEGGKR